MVRAACPGCGFSVTVPEQLHAEHPRALCLACHHEVDYLGPVPEPLHHLDELGESGA